MLSAKKKLFIGTIAREERKTHLQLCNNNTQYTQQTHARTFIRPPKKYQYLFMHIELQWTLNRPTMLPMGSQPTKEVGFGSHCKKKKEKLIQKSSLHSLFWKRALLMLAFLSRFLLNFFVLSMLIYSPFASFEMRRSKKKRGLDESHFLNAKIRT